MYSTIICAYTPPGLREYIKTNKHLPNIPTEKEVAIDGIELGDECEALREDRRTYVIHSPQQKQINVEQRISKQCRTS